MSAAAIVYLDELPPRPRPLPRFIDEFVMAQLANPEHLALLPDDTTRHLLVVIMETGLRITPDGTRPFSDATFRTASTPGSTPSTCTTRPASASS